MNRVTPGDPNTAWVTRQGSVPRKRCRSAPANNGSQMEAGERQDHLLEGVERRQQQANSSGGQNKRNAAVALPALADQLGRETGEERLGAAAAGRPNDQRPNRKSRRRRSTARKTCGGRKRGGGRTVPGRPGRSAGPAPCRWRRSPRRAPRPSSHEHRASPRTLSPAPRAFGPSQLRLTIPSERPYYARSRWASSRSRSAFSLMKPAASCWS